MTGDFNIKKIAIIGGGYSGLSTLADLLHTSSTGHSTIESAKRPEFPAFETIKLFEQNDRVGGAWNYSSETDPDLPDQEILETKQYWNPSDIIIEKKSEKDEDKNGIKKEYTWTNSAVYENLYTNISADFMTLSTLEKRNYPNRVFSPFLTHKEVLRILFDFVDKYALGPYIHYNSTVQNVIKDDAGKYHLTIRQLDAKTGKYTWSTETFDAIVASSGRFQYPHIPQIPNLVEYNARYPGVISHTKSFRREDDFKDKTVIIVGSSVSSVGVLEFLKPIVKKVFVSRRTFQDDTNTIQKYYNKAFSAEGVQQVGEIVNFDVENNEITFKTGEKAKNVDRIILATGFHIHYPFFDELSKTDKNLAKVEKANGDQRGLVKNLFHYVFAIGEPTIAHVGLPSTGFFVHAAESQGVAIAGVWSNAKKLPDVKTQQQWVADRLEQTKEQRVTHQFEPESIRKEIDLLTTEYGPIDRPSILPRVDTQLFEDQRIILEGIYEEFASGRVAADYVLKHDTSGL